MGCHTHTIRGVGIRFDECDDNYRCLCTFDGFSGIDDVARLRALAAFGAAAMMALNGEANDGEYLIIPGGLSEQFRRDLDRLLPPDAA